MLLDEIEQANRRPGWIKPLVLISGGLLGAIALGALVFGMFKDTGPRKKSSVQEISLLRPPPPPPPPKVEEKLPEPEIKKEEVKLPEDQPPEEVPQAEAPPPSPGLGVDAQGSGSGDGFGLQGRPGGQDITRIGGDGDRNTWYAGVLRAQIQRVLARNERLRGADFRVVVHVWVENDGSVRKALLADSTGDSDKDRRLQLALADIPALRETPPEGLPQPVRFRVVSTF